MSYCRWSDCDVYVYESTEGVWVIHVAGWRNAAGKPPPIDIASPETIKRSLTERRAWSEANTELVRIDLPYDGASFTCESPGECADQLEVLFAAGYDVPVRVIAELREEECAALGEDKPLEERWDD